MIDIALFAFASGIAAISIYRGTTEVTLLAFNLLLLIRIAIALEVQQ
jgi:hypothetical protein